jgi:hypothetical protein
MMVHRLLEGPAGQPASTDNAAVCSTHAIENGPIGHRAELNESREPTGLPAPITTATALVYHRDGARAPFRNDDEGPQQLLVGNKGREDPFNPPASIRSAALIHFCCRL